MLHWISLFLFYFVCVLISLSIYNRSLLQIILLGEVLLLLLFCILLTLASFYNIYYLIGISFILIVLGGLEISLNILLLTL